jgi:hypothetical protein
LLLVTAQAPGQAPTKSASAEAESWTEWSTSHGQHAELVAGGRVLFITAAGKQATKAQRKVIDTIARVFDTAFGPAAESPEHAAVLFYFEKQDHIDGALDRVQQLCSFNAAWATGMRSKFTDFVIEDPLVGGLAPFITASEEWNGDNELGHRLANLLLVQRFGHQPRWLAAGISWCFEQEALGSIYCFPDRDEFVSIAGHGGWAPELVKQAKAHKKSAFTMAEIAALTRGSFNDDTAARAWGASRFLLDNESKALPAILRELSSAWLEGGREPGANGTWTRAANFELPSEAQQAIIERHTAADLRTRITAAFADGIKPRTASSSRAQRSGTKTQ